MKCVGNDWIVIFGIFVGLPACWDSSGLNHVYPWVTPWVKFAAAAAAVAVHLIRQEGRKRKRLARRRAVEEIQG